MFSYQLPDFLRRCSSAAIAGGIVHWIKTGTTYEYSFLHLGPYRHLKQHHRRRSEEVFLKRAQKNFGKACVWINRTFMSQTTRVELHQLDTRSWRERIRRHAITVPNRINICPQQILIYIHTFHTCWVRGKNCASLFRLHSSQQNEKPRISESRLVAIHVVRSKLTTQTTVRYELSREH